MRATNQPTLLFYFLQNIYVDRFQALLRGEPADHDCEVVGWARRCAQRLHLLREELVEGAGIEHRLRLLEEVGLVGRPAPLGHEEELVLHAIHGSDVNLGDKGRL